MYNKSGNKPILDFSKETLLAFKFLEKEYEFKCVEKSKDFIRYESKAIFIDVTFNRSNGELEVAFGKVKDHFKQNARIFYLYDLVHLFRDADIPTGFPMFTAHTLEQLREKLKSIVLLLKEYGEELLKGNISLLGQLEKRQDLESKKLLCGDIRNKTNCAWIEKDFTQVVKLYEAIKDFLTPVELKKLEYAKKQVAKK